MKVFIGWSGERSRTVATALRDWIPDVLQLAKPWMSEADIAAGDGHRLSMGRSNETSFGIVCITPDNLGEPWIHFEAGAVAKAVKEDTFVCPYLIGLDPSQVSGPLSQFQMKKADREGSLDVIKSLNRALGELHLPDERLTCAFDSAWPRLKTTLDTLPPPTAPAPERDPNDIMREILEIVRRLDREASGLPTNPIGAAFLANYGPATGKSAALQNLDRLLRGWSARTGPPTISLPPPDEPQEPA